MCGNLHLLYLLYYWALHKIIITIYNTNFFIVRMRIFLWSLKLFNFAVRNWSQIKASLTLRKFRIESSNLKWNSFGCFIDSPRSMSWLSFIHSINSSINEPIEFFKMTNVIFNNFSVSSMFYKVSHGGTPACNERIGSCYRVGKTEFKSQTTARYEITNGTCACNHRWLKLISLTRRKRSGTSRFMTISIFFIARTHWPLYWEPRIYEWKQNIYLLFCILFVQK